MTPRAAFGWVLCLSLGLISTRLPAAPTAGRVANTTEAAKPEYKLQFRAEGDAATYTRGSDGVFVEASSYLKCRLLAISDGQSEELWVTEETDDLPDAGTGEYSQCRLVFTKDGARLETKSRYMKDGVLGDEDITYAEIEPIEGSWEDLAQGKTITARYTAAGLASLEHSYNDQLEPILRQTGIDYVQSVEEVEDTSRISVSIKTTAVSNERIILSPDSIICINNGLSCWTIRAAVSPDPSRRTQIAKP
jgi:hypothetical protein